MAAGGDLPHDLATFVIERRLGIEHGFWGCVAEGATFRTLGRKRTPQGKAVITKHAVELDDGLASVVQFGSSRTPIPRQCVRVDPRWGPVGAGIAAGLLAALLPDGVGVVVILIAALVAGWLLPDAPMKAAVLFVLPAIAIGFARMLVDDRSGAAGAFAFGSVVAVVVTAIFTQVGAGIALRRQRE